VDSKGYLTQKTEPGVTQIRSAVLPAATKLPV